MNFPLDLLFLSMYRVNPFKNLAWASWVTKGNTSAYSTFLLQKGGSGIPEEIFEANSYTRKTLVQSLQRNLEHFCYPSNYELDKHITNLFAVWQWVARWDAQCFTMLSRGEKEDFKEFHNRESPAYQEYVRRISAELHRCFPLALGSGTAPNPMQDMDQVMEAYVVIRNSASLLKIPTRASGGESGTTKTDHRVFDSRVASLLLGNSIPTDGYLSPGALVHELVSNIEDMVNFFWTSCTPPSDMGYWEALEESYTKEFGAGAWFSISAFVTPGDAGPMERLKYNKNSDEVQRKPGEDSASDIQGMLYTEEVLLGIRDWEDVVTEVTRLLMLTGYRYEKKCMDSIMAFRDVCRKIPAPRYIGTLGDILDRDATLDKYFHPEAMEPFPIPYMCVEYVIVLCKSYTSQDPMFQVTQSQWGAPQGRVTRKWASDPDPRQRPEAPAEPVPVEDPTLLYVLGGVAIFTAYAVLSR